MAAIGNVKVDVTFDDDAAKERAIEFYERLAKLEDAFPANSRKIAKALREDWDDEKIESQRTG